MLTIDGERHLSTFLGGDTDAMDDAVEAVHRRNGVAKKLGAFAINGTLSKAEEQVQAAFDIFVNAPHISLPAEAQLKFMGDTLIDLGGYNVPDLSRRQASVMETMTDKYHQRRVIPTPLLDIEGRQAIAEAARVFPAQQFDPNESALRLPDEGTVYAKLVQDLGATVEDEGIYYVVRYKTPDLGLGRLDDRTNYKAGLKEANQAIEEDGVTWTFPVMDVRIKTPREEQTARELYANVRPVASPESLILTAILHQAAGTPNPDGDIDFANEAVYASNEQGRSSRSLEYVSTIRWRSDWHRIGSYARQLNSTRAYMGVRASESGI